MNAIEGNHSTNQPAIIIPFTLYSTRVGSYEEKFLKMRLWSIHPKYLDTKGLVALWRESLLAKHVLEGKTKGYVHHPQLARFRKAQRPVEAINQYLVAVYEEAISRSYKFDKSKIDMQFLPATLPVTSGQLIYEKGHLLEKLKIRDKLFYKKLMEEDVVDSHPSFEVIDGGVEEWEVGGRIFPRSSEGIAKA